MSCFSSCGLRLFGGKSAAPLPPSVIHDEVEEQPRPYSGSTAVGTSTGTDAGTDEKEHMSVKRSRSRSRSVSQKLSVPVEAFTTALRDRARSRSRSKSLLPPKRPLEEDEKNLPSLPPSDQKPPRLSLDDEKAHTPSKVEPDQGVPRPDPDLVTVTGPAWPLRDDKDTRVDCDSKQRFSAGSKRANSIDSLDTPTSPNFPDEEKKRVVERLSASKRDANRDSKLKDEGLEDDDLPELETKERTPEQERKRKMRESRHRLKLETPKDEQDRMDMFQCM